MPNNENGSNTEMMKKANEKLREKKRKCCDPIFSDIKKLFSELKLTLKQLENVKTQLF